MLESVSLNEIEQQLMLRFASHTRLYSDESWSGYYEEISLPAVALAIPKCHFITICIGCLWSAIIGPAAGYDGGGRRGAGPGEGGVLDGSRTLTPEPSEIVMN